MLSGKGVNTILETSVKTEAVKWYNILKQIINVLFLGECGLTFNDSAHHTGDLKNGNFLGLLELLSKWVAIFQEHVLSVQVSQKGVE